LLVAHLGVAADKPEKSAATTNAVTGKWIYTLEVLIGNCFLTLRASVFEPLQKKVVVYDFE